MSKKRLVIISPYRQPYVNHAMEEVLMKHGHAYKQILYLWRNDPAVIFGRNQNPWREVHVEKAKEDGLYLLRRKSGGGAVYHDGGNLNFSFISDVDEHRVADHFSIVLSALERVGIEAEVTKRKDILVKGHKVSGNAFYYHGNRRLHHGTLLLKTDHQRLWQYLTSPFLRDISSGLPSVRSPVINLSQVVKDLSIDHMINELISSYYERHHFEVTTAIFQSMRKKFVKPYIEAYREVASWAWTFGQTPDFSLCESIRVQVDALEGQEENLRGLLRKKEEEYAV